MLSNFKIAEETRKDLKTPIGELIEELPRSGDGLIAVGDITTLRLLKEGITPDICVIDYKAEREPLSEEDVKTLKALDVQEIKAENNAGEISLSAWKAFEDALKNTPAKIVIDGEDDLLALAALFLAPEGSKVIYGQPDIGTAMFEVSDKLRQKYVEVLIHGKGREFLNSIQGKVVIVHDSDADGACSAIVFAKYLEDRKVEVVLMESSDPLIHSNTKKEIRKTEAENLIVLDLGSEAYDSLKELSEEMHVMVLDHHKVVGSPDFGKTLVLNPHLFKLPDEVVGPTSYLAYVICQELDWVAIIGTIADKGFYPAEELLSSVKKRYKVDFERLSQMFEAGAVLRKLAETRDAVRNAESPEEVEKSETLIGFEKEYLQELERLKKLHETDAEELAEGRIILFDFTSEYRVRGMVSNMLQSMYTEKSIIVAEKVGQHYYFSMRAGGQKVDLVKIIKYAIEGLAESNGGGHTKAAGARVMAGDRDKFISGFVEKFKEI
ncbi:MAG: hypothetical protein CL963_01680 [Euryarchaeota archaeon]|nr:hypothetical protein [Euryarchaeota archaeon]HIK01464.1 DUF359 domain-containing protein [Candidatus Undinarchaeales archaeon ERR594346 U_76725]|tara:strand:- start:14651 stop:16132 length:1482 start_codon:yes stop_codon:yes gene_type:complete